MNRPDISFEDKYDLYLGGSFTPPADGEYRPVIDPATGSSFTSVGVGTPADIDHAVSLARTAAARWRDVPPDERGRLVYRVSELIDSHAEELAAIESKDQGKPLSQARSDMRGARRYFEYYAGAADKLEGRSVPVGPDQVDYTVREPYGVSAQVTPWNFPGNLFARGVAPALVAGNAVVVKPAPETALSTLYLAELCTEAGLPDGVVNVVTGPGDPTGEALVSHPDVDTITFTGSVDTGQHIMKRAAETVTPVTLELGGKNPAIVFPDADLDSVAEHITTAIFTNAGQVCSAADRLLVHESVHDELLDRIVSTAEKYDIGPGWSDPDLGPLVSEAHFHRVREYIETGQNEGATLVTGGESMDRPGYFVEPTVFTDVTPEMQIAQEEIFGPVLSVFRFTEEQDAIELANGVEYGLTAGVFTNDLTRAHRFTRSLEAGTVYVNTWFGDTTQTPFGGYNQSGIGREKGFEALDSYLQTKNIAIGLEDEADGLPGA